MHNEFDCPVCDDVVEVPLPYAKHVTCPNGHKLEIHPDAEFDGLWHDRTTLSAVLTQPANQNDSKDNVDAVRGLPMINGDPVVTLK